MCQRIPSVNQLDAPLSSYACLCMLFFTAFLPSAKAELSPFEHALLLQEQSTLARQASSKADALRSLLNEFERQGSLNANLREAMKQAIQTLQDYAQLTLLRTERTTDKSLQPQREPLQQKALATLDRALELLGQELTPAGIRKALEEILRRQHSVIRNLRALRSGNARLAGLERHQLTREQLQALEDAEASQLEINRQLERTIREIEAKAFIAPGVSFADSLYDRQSLQLALLAADSIYENKLMAANEYQHAIVILLETAIARLPDAVAISMQNSKLRERLSEARRLHLAARRMLLEHDEPDEFTALEIARTQMDVACVLSEAAGTNDRIDELSDHARRIARSLLNRKWTQARDEQDRLAAAIQNAQAWADLALPALLETTENPATAPVASTREDRADTVTSERGSRPEPAAIDEEARSPEQLEQDLRIWIKGLPARERQRVEQAMRQHLPERYREQIMQYYRNLARMQRAQNDAP